MNCASLNSINNEVINACNLLFRFLLSLYCSGAALCTIDKNNFISERTHYSKTAERDLKLNDLLIIIVFNYSIIPGHAYTVAGDRL